MAEIVTDLFQQQWQTFFRDLIRKWGQYDGTELYVLIELVIWETIKKNNNTAVDIVSSRFLNDSNSSDFDIYYLFKKQRSWLKWIILTFRSLVIGFVISMFLALIIGGTLATLTEQRMRSFAFVFWCEFPLSWSVVQLQPLRSSWIGS